MPDVPKKSTAKKTTPAKPKAALGDCYAGDGPGVGTALTAFGPRVVCGRHKARALAAGRVVR